MSMEQISLDFSPARRVYTVAELSAAIRALLGGEFQDIWVAGEISGVKLAASGHYYFTLKDEPSQLRCVCFRASARYLRFKPQDGIAVLARGRIDVYEATGRVPVAGGGDGAAGLRRAAAGLRAVEEEARRRRTVRRVAQASAARVCRSASGS